MPISIPGFENLSQAVKYLIAFAVIFLVASLFAFILRRLTGNRMPLSSERGRARQPRLGIVDVYDLDRQRQLILLRRDNVEHLLLVGGPNDVVVETNIVRVPGARLPSGAAEAGDRTEIEAASTRPVIEAGPARTEIASRPDAAVSARLGASDAREGGGALEAALKPTRVTAAATPPTPMPPVRQAPPRPTPTRANPAPARSNNSGEGPGQPDPNRQLEEVLRRPPQGPTPEPPRMPSTADAPRGRQGDHTPTPPSRSRQSEGRGQPAPQYQPRPDGGQRPDSGSAARGGQPAPYPQAESAPQPLFRPPPQPSNQAPQPQPAGMEAGGSGQPPESVAKPDPFSIEDIEAEFARLLGRPLDRKEQ